MASTDYNIRQVLLNASWTADFFSNSTFARSATWRRHMTSEILVSTGSVDDWRHQVITWTSVELKTYHRKLPALGVKIIPVLIITISVWGNNGFDNGIRFAHGQGSQGYMTWCYDTSNVYKYCFSHALYNGMKQPWYMMTSSNGNIFRVTGHLCGEFTGPRWIPSTKASDAELWCFLWSAPE